MGKIGLLVKYDGHWDGAQFMGSSPFGVCVSTEEKHDQLLDKIYQRVGVDRDRFELRLSTMVNTKMEKIILPILCDGDVEFVLVNTECTPVVFVEVVERPVAEDKAGGGNGKEAVGKPSECGTSRNADKKRKRMPEGECSESYEADNGDEHEDVDLAAQNFALNTGHPTRRNSRQKQNVSYCESKIEDNDFVNPAKSSNGIKLSNASEEEEQEVDPELLNYPGPEFNRSSCLIYPKRGETWALFRDWHIKWSDNPEKHEPPYQYEFVEVLTDFKENVGIGVVYLGKVKGFVSVFQRIAKNGVLSFNIAPGELYRFSHQIPSFRMTGKERDGVPEGSFELDPASLPNDKPSDLGNHKMENRKLDTEPSGSCPRSSQGNVKSTLPCMKSSTLKKHESHPNRENSERKNHNKVEASQCTIKEEIMDFIPSQPKLSTTYPADERTRTPVKHKETDFAMDALRLRKSPRDLSKKSNQVNASEPTTQEDTNKHLDAKNNEKHNSVPQSKESASSSVSDVKMHLPVKKESSTKVMDTSDSPALPTTISKVVEAELYDFKQNKSEEKFELEQIWALYSDSDAMPKSYAQVKVIYSRLYVALFEACSPPKDPSRPVCCGTFKLKNCNLKVLPRSAFSHQLKAKPFDWGRFEVYPQKGQVWALYRNWNSESTYSEHDKGECVIVEVLEDNDQCIKVAVLTCVNAAKALYRAPRNQRSKTGFMEIRKDDVTRFSHQIPAVQLTGEKEIQFRGYWNLDPLAIPGTVVCFE